MSDSSNNSQYPKVGLGVIVIRDGKILLGERLSERGTGMYQIAGGHLEFGETFEEGARREVREETGLTDIIVKGVVSVGNDIAFDAHYITVGLLAESLSGEPSCPEPDESRNWQWYDLDNLPSPILPYTKRAIDNWRSGKLYTDHKVI